MSKGLNWSRAKKANGTADGLREFRRERELAELATWIDAHGGRKVDAGTKWIAGARDPASQLIAIADRNVANNGKQKRGRRKRNRKKAARETRKTGDDKWE